MALMITESVTQRDTASLQQARMRLLVFEVQSTGHRPGYLLNLARHWHQAELPLDLSLVVTDQFAKSHPNVLDEVAGFGNDNIRFVPMSENEFPTAKAPKWITHFRGWRLMREYAQRLRADHVLFSDFDSFNCQLGWDAPPPVRIRVSIFVRRSTITPLGRDWVGRTRRPHGASNCYCLVCCACDN